MLRLGLLPDETWNLSKEQLQHDEIGRIFKFKKERPERSDMKKTGSNCLVAMLMLKIGADE